MSYNGEDITDYPEVWIKDWSTVNGKPCKVKLGRDWYIYKGQLNISYFKFIQWNFQKGYVCPEYGRDWIEEQDIIEINTCV